jgi:aminodeoxychorismate lyase
MIVFLNGEFVGEELARVSVFDRSFLYGDGLFETMRVAKGRPFRWAQHQERLERGAEFLGINLPFTGEALQGFAAELILKNALPEGLLRLTLSRGVGPRGYSPKGANQPVLVMSTHPLPPDAGQNPSWRLVTATHRLPAGESLAQFKTANKLAQVLARAEADAAGADEALLLNTDGFVVEGSTSNLFWIQGGAVCTPPLASGVLAGVTRAVTFEICRDRGLPVAEAQVTPDELCRAEGVFVTLSTLGVVEADELNRVRLRRSPQVERIRRAYAELLARE